MWSVSYCSVRSINVKCQLLYCDFEQNLFYRPTFTKLFIRKFHKRNPFKVHRSLRPGWSADVEKLKFSFLQFPFVKALNIKGYSIEEDTKQFNWPTWRKIDRMLPQRLAPQQPQQQQQQQPSTVFSPCSEQGMASFCLPCTHWLFWAPGASQARTHDTDCL